MTHDPELPRPSSPDQGEDSGRAQNPDIAHGDGATPAGGRSPWSAFRHSEFAMLLLISSIINVAVVATGWIWEEAHRDKPWATSPTAKPTAGPMTSPTAKPTAGPTTSPTAKPTAKRTSIPRAKPTTPPTQQGEFVKSINDERGNLYTGIASAGLYKYAEVGRSFPIDLKVCGSAVTECSITEATQPGPAGAPADGSGKEPKAMPAPRGANSPLGKVMVGGRVKAELSTYQSQVEIKANSPEIQTITEPNDVGQWTWKVTATGNDDLNLQIAVTTLRADSDVALYPTRFFNIAIRIKETLGHGVGSAAKVTWAVAGGTAGIAALLAALIAYLVRQDNRRKDGGAAAPLPSGPVRNAPASQRPQSTGGRKRTKK